jgi:trigger factor
LKVEVPAPAVEAERRRVIDEYRRQVKIPGFRQGKIPAEIVQQKFQEEIEKEIIERLVPRYWHQAEAESELQPLLPPSVEDVDLQPGAGLTFLATVEIRPEVEIGEIEEFELPELVTEPTVEEVDRAIEDMRRAVADWVVVDRAAAQGDLVSGQLHEVSESREGEQDAAAQPFAFEVGDPQIWEELSLEVTGKEAGRSGEFERREGEGEDEIKRHFRVEVESVKARDLPPIDDELAKKVGEFSDVEEMRQAFHDRLVAAKKRERQRSREQALLEHLRDRYPLALPTGVVDKEIEGLLREYAQSLAQQGVDVENAGIDWQEMGDRLRPQGERRVHARLLLDAITEERGVEISEGEFESALAAIARAQNQTSGSLRQALDRAGRLSGLRTQLRRDKALRQLLGESGDDGSGETAAPAESATEDPDQGSRSGSG